ncbi:MAG: Mur ligase family protein [Rickettsiales bacterium]|nr:Mur ligase family protein [Rickettsiales bacterium]
MITQIFCTLSIIIFSFFRFKVLILFFQQDEYRNKWFLSFAFKNLKLIDKKLVFLIVLIWAFSLINPILIYLLAPVLIIFAVLENKVLKKAKKGLNITSRVKRILSVAMFLTICISIALSFWSWIGMSIIAIELLPLILIISNIILKPIENRIQKKYLKEAKDILAKLQPTVIGITGSYGKTSTKHVLAHILSGNLPVLWTPGSVNTEMGVCRIIREKLQEQHKYFIVEMGAYFKGSIKKLCDFVNPKHGIITAVGEAHYEHFKTQKIIAEAKFELGECVEKNHGILIVNTNQINAEYIPEKMPLIQVGDNQNIHISNIKQTKEGLYFIYHKDREETQIFAPIFGEHHTQNIALAITMALELGMSMSTISIMLKTLPQITHRLEVKPANNGITIIDDAYNSNPTGFKSAINLLKTLKT